MSIFSGTASNSEHYKNSVKRSLPFLFRTHARLSLARVSSTFLSWSEIRVNTSQKSSPYSVIFLARIACRYLSFTLPDDYWKIAKVMLAGYFKTLELE